MCYAFPAERHWEIAAMKCHSTRGPTILSVVALLCGCNDGSGATGPEESDLISGVRITATVVELSDKLISVQVSLANTTSERIDLHYPAGCPVRLRFYRALDSALVYDEAAFPCDVDVAVDLSIPPASQRVLTSGTRFTWEISGDSLPIGAYHVAGILRILGQNPLELPAGLYSLRVVAPPGRPAERHFATAATTIRRTRTFR
jgi:hypothetical protein